jgi:hypothetical protein
VKLKYIQYIYKAGGKLTPTAQAHFVSLSGNMKNKHWAFSARLNKLFVDINRWVQVSSQFLSNIPDLGFFHPGS